MTLRVVYRARPACSKEDLDSLDHLPIRVLDRGVLALVLLPGADEERLGEERGILGVAVQTPARRACAPSQAPKLGNETQICVRISGGERVLDPARRRVPARPLEPGSD